MESISHTKPGIFRRSVGFWKSIYNHKDFVKYTLYTVTGTTVVLGIWVYFRERQKKKLIALSTINLQSSPQEESVKVAQHAQIFPSGGRNSMHLELGGSSMISSSESCSSLPNSASMSSEELNVVIHECLSRGLRELKLGLDLSGYSGDGSRSESESSTPGSLSRSSAVNGRKRVNSRRRMGSLSNSMSSSTVSTTEILEEVATILKAQQRIEQIIESDPSLASDSIKEIIQHVRTESESSGNESVKSAKTVRSGRWSPSGSSVDSFMTADDDFENLASLQFLSTAYDLVDEDRIYTRKIRFELCGVQSEREFLAKLHCIREAEKLWLRDKQSRIWLRDVTCVILTGLLKADGTDPEPCQENFESLCEWCEGNYDEMCKSLSQKGIAEISIFDVVIDLCLLDSFDLLANPPSAMMSVLSNRWMSEDFKRTAMTTALWSYISRCRSDPSNENPFMVKLFDLAKTIAPAICWGQMGPQRKFGELFRSFKAEIISLSQDLFAYRDSWGSKERLSNDLRNIIASACHRLIDILNEKTDSEILFIEPPEIKIGET
ncbi:unnamed protein product [Oikopleura dioica]|uniref:Uncharacterized protein n=1 Tax=Oikopleura dioica TaxID=34765 RepID=E4YFD4_OIKDI|nr:unnamed protein product [Oikopleura dioica]